MSEAEFNLLLDAVRTAIAKEPEEEFLPHARMSYANDNDPAWPFVPFPDGWYAAS